MTVIEGRVVDGTDRRPLALANVFISNSTNGQTTDEQGRFRLTAVPSGVVNLVVTYVGYETFSLPVRTDTLRRPLEILLLPKATELQAVTIKRLRNGYQDYFPLFQEHFMGQTAFSKTCKLLNPKALWFSMSEDQTTLTVQADEPLLIENEALGYRVHYTLESFTYVFRGGYASQLGYCRFEEMATKKSKKRERWTANRRKAYLGSPQHFFASLLEKRATPQGFTVYKLIRQNKRFVSAPRVPEGRDSLGRVVRPASPERISFDTTDLALSRDPALRKVAGNPFDRYVQYLVNQPLDESTLVQSENNRPVLRFDQHLYVVYDREVEESQFLKPGQKNVPQTSVLTLTDSAAGIEPNGHLSEPLSILFEGRWAREKMGELLPLDYVLTAQTP